MKRLALSALVTAALIAAAALSRHEVTPPAGDLLVETEERNPWTHLRLNNDADQFQFAIISDRTGGHRAQVFSRAVAQLNLLQPEFVLSVGDLIEGYTQDGEKLAAEWREFQGYVAQLQMPFFYVPGNHDVSNPFQEQAWKERFGRRYYHFVYRDVLFLALHSDDPPVKDGGLLGREQIDYVRRTLEANRRVRWTVVCLHKPLWNYPDLEKNGWLDVESALAGRRYTVFAG